MRVLAPLLIIFALVLPGRAAEPPRQIVSLGPLNTKNVLLLGAGDRLVGVSRYCLLPGRKSLPRVGSVLQVSIEKVLALHPDLVLATGLTPAPTVNRLHRLGLRVVRINQPRSFEDLCQGFLDLGELLGKSGRARSLVRQVRARVERVRSRVAGQDRMRVFLQVGASPLFGGAPGSFLHDYIRLAGGINVLADQESGRVGYEKVLARDPQVIIIAIMGSESGVAAAEKKKWLGFPGLAAVRDQRVYLLEPDLVCSPSPLTFARTLETIASLLHPGLFPAGPGQ